MSQERSRRGGQKAKAPAGAKNGNKGGNRSRGGGAKQKQSRPPALDPQRPFWANDAAEADVRAIIGVVVPAQDPTALVRSLGSPPLGRFADNAQHYYAAVYEKAQRFAIAMATANGVRVMDGTEHEAAGAVAAGADHP